MDIEKLVNEIIENEILNITISNPLNRVIQLEK